LNAPCQLQIKQLGFTAPNQKSNEPVRILTAFIYCGALPFAFAPDDEARGASRKSTAQPDESKIICKEQQQQSQQKQACEQAKRACTLSAEGESHALSNRFAVIPHAANNNARRFVHLVPFSQQFC
jgi:hypothetical protein